jgi:hypothetical protein
MQISFSPKVSIILPIHNMKNGAFFLWRAINSIMEQTFKDYEIVITKEGKMAENTNAGTEKSKGELIKILYMDDYFSSPTSLKEMVDNFGEKDSWMIVGTEDNPSPYWTDDLETGNNKLGSPSALIMRATDRMLFDEKLSWLLDCDLYKRMEHFCGKPKILNGNYITIGKHDGQMTHLMSDHYKLSEHEYVREKYN